MKFLEIYENWTDSTVPERKVSITIPYHDGSARYKGILKKGLDGSDVFVPVEFDCDNSVALHKANSLRNHFQKSRGMEKKILVKIGTAPDYLKYVPLGKKIQLWIAGGLAVGEEAMVEEEK